MGSTTCGTTDRPVIMPEHLILMKDEYLPCPSLTGSHVLKHCILLGHVNRCERTYRLGNGMYAQTFHRPVSEQLHRATNQIVSGGGKGQSYQL